MIDTASTAKVPQSGPGSGSVNVYQAKTHLSQLLTRVQAGEEIIISRSGKPIAKLCGVGPDPGPRTFFQDEGLFEVPEDFDDLPEDLLREFERDLEGDK